MGLCTHRGGGCRYRRQFAGARRERVESPAPALMESETRRRRQQFAGAPRGSIRRRRRRWGRRRRQQSAAASARRRVLLLHGLTSHELLGLNKSNNGSSSPWTSRAVGPPRLTSSPITWALRHLCWVSPRTLTAAGPHVQAPHEPCARSKTSPSSSSSRSRHLSLLSLSL